MTTHSLRQSFSGWLVVFLAFTWARAEPAGRIVPNFAALAREAMTTLPSPPAWDMTQPAAVWTIDELKAELAKITDKPPRVNSVRSTVLRPGHKWFKDFGSWFRSVQKPLKIRFVDDLWDCDNYANCFVAFADVIALKAGEKRGSFCIGWATVYYQRPFAGIRAGGAHAVVIVGTTEGLFIVEPQDGTMIALSKYPNRDTMEEITF